MYVDFCYPGQASDGLRLCRVILRHVLKVSEQGEKCRKEEELAAKQANKGKKKSSKKMKLKKFAEELDVQAIMLDLFQVRTFLTIMRFFLAL